MEARLVSQRILIAAGLAAAVTSQSVHGLGTSAGADIQNTATVNFSIGGAPQTPVISTSVQIVDELLDVAVVDDIGGPVGVSSPDSNAILQFTVTNNGNGTEVFQIIADETVAEGGFDPSIDQLYLESNGIPGLQVGGDTAYVSGAGDPSLDADESLTVYVVSTIPGGRAAGDDGDVALRAVAQTIIAQTGVDDPDVAGWPAPGDSYAGQGDGGGAAVVGSSHDLGSLLVRTTGRYEVANAVVGVTKTALAVVDPFGGTTLVPGSIITYQVELSVTGAGSAEGVVMSDIIPAEVEYVAGTLRIDGVLEDDDFAPAATDLSGYDGPNTTIVVDRGTVAGGAPTVVITYDASIR